MRVRLKCQKFQPLNSLFTKTKKRPSEIDLQYNEKIKRLFDIDESILIRSRLSQRRLIDNIVINLTGNKIYNLELSVNGWPFVKIEKFDDLISDGNYKFLKYYFNLKKKINDPVEIIEKLKCASIKGLISYPEDIIIKKIITEQDFFIPIFARLSFI